MSHRFNLEREVMEEEKELFERLRRNIRGRTFICESVWNLRGVIYPLCMVRS